MLQNLPTLIVGLLVPAALIIAAALVVRGIRKSLRNPSEEYTGAMGSAAMEAMMAEARRQRAMLNDGKEEDAPSDGEEQE